MARPKKLANTPDTRDQIIDAARIEFSNHGLAAPLEAIAERCGIKRPSLLHHFKSKQTLIAAVIEDIQEKVRTRLREVITASTGDYHETVLAILKALRQLEEEERGVAGTFFNAMLVEGDDSSVSTRVGELIEVVHATALMAGAGKEHPSTDMRAVIAHLVMGELARIALGSKGDVIWGSADGVNPLFEGYFLSDQSNNA